MAVKMVFMFILPLLLRASLSLPISLDVKLTNSVPESGLTESKPVLDSETILRIEEDNKLVQSLSTKTLLKAFESFEAVHGRRIKRYITTTSELCPKDMFRYSSWCLTKEQYKTYKDDSEDSDDYEEER